jgi:ribonuclease P protein component
MVVEYWRAEELKVALNLLFQTKADSNRAINKDIFLKSKVYYILLFFCDIYSKFIPFDYFLADQFIHFNLASSMRKYGLPKSARLKSRKVISALFTGRTHVFQYPFKLVYTFVEEPNPTSNVKMAVTVSKRRFKSAVKRNLVKRRTKEAYRIAKPELLHSVQPADGSYAMMLIYIGKEIEPYAIIEHSMKGILKKFVHAIESPVVD